MRLRLLLVLPGAVALSCGLSPNPDIPSIGSDGDYSMDADGGDGDSSGSGGSSAGTGGVDGGAETTEQAGAGGEADQ